MDEMQRVLTRVAGGRRHRLTAARAVLSVACCLAAACSKEHDPATGTVTVPAAAAGAIQPVELQDQAIDPSDSYLITSAVTRTTSIVESEEPFVDPLTGEQVTRLTLPDVIDSVRLEAGYDANGVVRMSEYRSGNDSGGVAARVQIVGNTATFYDATGAVVHDTSGSILMEALGSMDDVIITSQSVFRDESEPALRISGSAQLAHAAGSAAGPKVEKHGDRLYQTFPLDDPAAGVRGQRVRQFRKSGRDWVVAEERIQTTNAIGKVSFEVIETTTYPVVKYRINDERDASRRGRRAAAPKLSKRLAMGPSPSSVTTVGSDEPVCFLCADGGGTGGGGGGGGGVVDPRLTGMPKVNLVLQHGAFADAGSWFRMDPWLKSRFFVVRKLVPSLDWKKGIESQATTLRDMINADGGTGFILIGHSNGGLVARRAAQLNVAAGSPVVGGVIAIASPHQGLPLATNSRAIVSNLLSTHLRDVLAKVGGSCGGGQYKSICSSMNDALLTLVPNIVNYALDNTIPMSADVKAGSPYTKMLNSQPEPFLRYSVEVESQGAWKFVRMVGDWKCNPEDRCSGDHLQNAMESAYDVLKSCSNEFAKALGGSAADRCRNVRWSLSNLNLLYERLTAPGDAGDGLVPVRSQVYPGLASENRDRLRNARVSHVGELKSEDVRDQVSRFIHRHSLQGI